jgi:hypothetical protein
MANAFVLRNCFASFDGVDLSDHVRDVEVITTAADVNVTAMGANGQQHLAGIRDDRFTFTMFSDFTTSKVHDTFYAKFAAAGTVAVIVRPTNGTVSAANPQFTGGCPILTYTPIGGAVGDAAMTPIELPVNGTISYATV